MKTKEKIVNVSLALFNEQGECNVTTNHIAAHVGISPGNLYYHFRNKEDIIHSIIEQYAAVLAQVLPPLDPAALEPGGLLRLSHDLDAILGVMWQYRFLGDNLPELLSRAQALRQQYLGVQTCLDDRLRADLRAVADEGLIKVGGDEQPAMERTLQMVLMFWISYKKIMLGTQSLERKLLWQGRLQALMVIRPYLTAAGCSQWRELPAHHPDPGG